MSNGIITTPGKSFWRPLLERSAKTAILPASLLLVAVLAYYLEHWLFPEFERSKLAFFTSVFCWYAAVIVTALISAHVFKSFATDKAIDDHTAAQKEWEDAISQLRQAHTDAQTSSKATHDENISTLAAASSKLQQELRALGDEKLAFAAEREQTRRSLAEQERHFYDMLKSQHDWLYNHEQVLQVEEDTDLEILVLAPDFFYEQQPQFENVIIQNLLKPAAPAYEYFVPKSHQNEGALQDLRERLENGLAKRSCANPHTTVQSRFKVHLIPDEEFPHCVAYGLAIYRFKEQIKNRCLVYWPKEIGSWNLDILAAGKQGEGKKIVDAITSHLQAIAKKYPAR